MNNKTAIPVSGDIMMFQGAGEKMECISRSLPELNEGEILVRNMYTTLCGSDLHTYSGSRKEPTPTVLGHETVGEIVKIGSGHPGYDYNGCPLAAGDRVTWTLFSSDPDSAITGQGIPQKSGNLFKYGHALITDECAFHGGLAEYCILKKHTVVIHLSQAIPLPVAATINCAVATVSGAVRLAGTLHNRKVLITGMGLLGMMCAAMCKVKGASVIHAADISERRLQQSRLFGVDQTHTISGLAEEKINSRLPDKADIVFDMSGYAETMELGLSLLKVGGTAIWIGAVFENGPVRIDPQKVVRNILTIKGLHNYNYEDFVHAADFVSRYYELFPFGTLIEKEFELQDAEAAFRYALNYKPVRVGIRI